MPEVPHFESLIQMATDFSSHAERQTRTRATKLVKELSQVALNNPFEHSKQEEFLRNNQLLGPQDFSPMFMHCYDYFMQTRMG